VDAPFHAAAADLNTDAGRAALLAACPEPDILVNNNAGSPRSRPT
jgi:3-oxoacyl-[acyl-carrier protein] reductase